MSELLTEKRNKEAKEDVTKLISRAQLAEEIKKINQLASESTSEYARKHMQTQQMELKIVTNEDGTYEFIEQEKTSSGSEFSRWMLR